MNIFNTTGTTKRRLRIISEARHIVATAARLRSLDTERRFEQQCLARGFVRGEGEAIVDLVARGYGLNREAFRTMIAAVLRGDPLQDWGLTGNPRDIYVSLIALEQQMVAER